MYVLIGYYLNCDYLIDIFYLLQLFLIDEKNVNLNNKFTKVLDLCIFLLVQTLKTLKI